MELLEYRPGDEHAVATNRGADEEPAPYDWLAPEIWRWRHREGPQGPERALFAWEGGKLLGHAAAVRTELSLGDRRVKGAQIFFHSPARAETFSALHRGLLELLSADGVELAYAVASDDERAHYEALRFTPLFGVHRRNLYLGLSGLSEALDRQALRPFRRLAREAWRLRAKLIEVAIDQPSIAQAAKLLAMSERAGSGEVAEGDGEPFDLALVRSEAWLAWRYAMPLGPPLHLLTLRRRAGAPIDGVAVVRTFEPKPGRVFIQLLQHATREREAPWLLGEVALWGLVEKADVLQAFAARGSVLDRALVSSGCIRKKHSRHFLASWIGRGPSPIPAAVRPRFVDLQAADLEL